MASKNISAEMFEMHKKFSEAFKLKKADETLAAWSQNLAQIEEEAEGLEVLLKEKPFVSIDQYQSQPEPEAEEEPALESMETSSESMETSESECLSLDKDFDVYKSKIEVKPERKRFASIKDGRNVVISKCPIIKIDRVSPIPNMTTWVPAQRNFAIPDCDAKKATIHVPYFGEETFEEEEDFLELLEKDRDEVASKEKDDACDDYIFYNSALSLIEKATMEPIAGPSSSRTPRVVLPEHEGIKLPTDDMFLLLAQSFEGIRSPSQLRTKFINMSRVESAKKLAPLAPESNSSFNADGPHHVRQRRIQTMDTFHRTFCRRCFTYNCQIHLESADHVFPEYQKKKGPLLVPRGPCSDTCYLTLTQEDADAWSNLFLPKSKFLLPTTLPDDTPIEVSRSRAPSRHRNSDATKEVEWSIGDANMYEALASVYPENYCVIGEIMQKPCKLVQQHALLEKDTCEEVVVKGKPGATSAEEVLSLFSRVQVARKTGKKKGDPLKRLRPIRPISPNARYSPCFHPGSSCGPDNRECACKVANTYCEKFCNCDDLCKNRFQGCWCYSKCSSGLCPCFAAGRECDPDLCNNCGAGKCDGSTTCTNIPIQKGVRKHLLLAKSDIPKAGWGIFTKHTIAKNEFIYEYAGELISHAEGERRGLAYDKRGHTYLFELNDHFMIDAMVKGNKMRFANHSDNPNCTVKVMMVNGDHRIGVFAKRNISAGEELYLYYKNVLAIHQEEKEKRDEVRNRKHKRKFKK